MTLTKQDQRTIQIMKLLADPTRFKIFKILSKHQQLCVGEIAKRIHVSTSAVSQHFRFFEATGLVVKERSGQKICYKLQQSNDLAHALSFIQSNKEE